MTLGNPFFRARRHADCPLSVRIKLDEEGEKDITSILGITKTDHQIWKLIHNLKPKAQELFDFSLSGQAPIIISRFSFV